MVAAVAAVAVAGCTGTPGPVTSTPSRASADTSSRTTTATAATATPSAPAAPVHPHTVSFAPAWRWALPGPGVGVSRQVAGVAQDATRVYVAVSSDTRGSLYAVSLRTGRVLWNVALTGSATAAPIVVGTHVLVDNSTSAGDGLVAVDAASGRLAWRHADIQYPPLAGSFAVRMGTAVFVSDTVGKKSYITRLDATTGKVTARHATNGGVLAAAGTKVLVEDGFHLSSYPVALNRADWTVPSTDLSAYDLYTDSTIVSTVADETSGSVTGIDPKSGRRLWRQAIGGAIADTFSTAGPNVLFTDRLCESRCSMTAITAQTGAIRWKTFDSNDTATYAAPDVGADGMLLCGANLLSVSAASGALYETAPQPNKALCSGPLLRTDDQAGTTAAHHVLTFAEDEVRSYATTTANDPPVRTDQNGGWGKVDPKQCQVNPTTTTAGLTADYGGTWLLTIADEDGTCFWTRGRTNDGVQVTTRLVGTAVDAKAYLNPKNFFGGCVRPGYSKSGHSGTAPATGLPAGSGLCYSTRYYFLGDKSIDSITGVTRASSGRYVAVNVDGLPWGTVTSAGSLKHFRDVLARLATR